MNSGWLIKNGKIVTSGKSFSGNLLLKDGVIKRIFPADAVLPKGFSVLDASDKIVCPGFIDLHTHSDLYHTQADAEPIKAVQGVTTEIFGNCGFSPAPLSVEHSKYREALKTYAKPILGDYGSDWRWRSFREYLSRLGECDHPTNIGTFVGCGALRIAVKGFENTPVTSVEMDKMCGLLRDSLRAGAFGLSLGLMYVPENYFRVEEMEQLCRVTAAEGGILTTHIRGEGHSLLPSLEEVILLAKRTGVALHISHLKAAGLSNWGKTAETAIELLLSERAAGLDITCDIYPYTASSTVLTSLFPPWMMEGGNRAAITRLQNRSDRAKIFGDMKKEGVGWDNLVLSTGWDRVVITYAKGRDEFSGKSVTQIAGELKLNPLECAFKIFTVSEGDAAIVFFSMSEEDLKGFLKLDFCSVISDSLYGEEGLPHPRLSGSFERLFARYVREQGVLSVEDAVKKVTELPARRIGLSNRGHIKEGFAADITIFDPESIQDLATFTEPRKRGKGIEAVFVNGSEVILGASPTNNKSGKLLRRKGQQI